MIDDWSFGISNSIFFVIYGCKLIILRLLQTSSFLFQAAYQRRSLLYVLSAISPLQENIFDDHCFQNLLTQVLHPLRTLDLLIFHWLQTAPNVRSGNQYVSSYLLQTQTID